MRRHHPILLCLVAGFCLVRQASALDQVVVSQRAGGPDVREVVDSLRIQFVGIALVIDGPAVEGPAPRAIQQVSRLLEELQASFGVWIDPRPDGDETRETIVAYVVPRPPGRVTQVSASEGPGVERTLALKVREAIDAALSDRMTAPASIVAPVASPSVPRGSSRQSAGDSSASLTVETSAAGVVPADGDGGVQLGAHLAGGLRIAAGQFELEPMVGFTLLTPMQSAHAGHEVRVDTRGARLELRGLGFWGDFGLGGQLWLGADLLEADGRAVDGKTGSETRLLPRMGVGPVFRFRLHPQLELNTSLAADLALLHQRFTVRGEPLFDVGKTRFEAHIGVVAFTL